MRANTAFSLGAAAVSLLICAASAAKGRWAVAIVFGLLVAGFLLRALEGRCAKGPERTVAAAEEPDQSPLPPQPAHEERRIKPARFKRR